MKLADTLIAWNAVRPWLPATERGRIVLLRWPRDAAEGEGFQFQAGGCDLDARDPSVHVETYIQALAKLMVERDSVLPFIVRRRLSQIDGVRYVFVTDREEHGVNRNATQDRIDQARTAEGECLE